MVFFFALNTKSIIRPTVNSCIVSNTGDLTPPVTNKLRKYDSMPLANIRQATTTFSLIADPEQVRNADNLTTEDGRKLLTVKGGTSQRLIGRVLTEFSQRLDRAGNKFQMSRKWRGLSMTDPYGTPCRVSGPDLEFFLTEWFLFVELVHSAPPRTPTSPPLVGGQQQYLKVLDRLPPFVTALVNQSRFVTQELVSMFDVID